MSVEFYNELRANTFSNIDNRRMKQEDERQRHSEYLNSVLSNFEEMLMLSLREKMLEASRDGHFYATIYTFTNIDTFEDLKTVFLLKGPYRSGNLFFEQQGIVPLITRLRLNFDPIDIYMNYDRGTKMHRLMASWKFEN